MNKQLFKTITKQAHKLTKEYRKRFSCDYIIQYGIFFKMLNTLYKRKNIVESIKQVDARSLYSVYTRFYKEHIKRACKDVVFYIRGKGLNIQAYINIVDDKGNEVPLNLEGLYLSDMLKYGINIFKWI